MRILIYSKAFAPDIGGVETYTRELALGLAVQGHDVTVATQSDRADHDDATLPFSVVRLRGSGRLIREIRRADIVHVAGAALLPMLLCFMFRKVFVVEHHNYQSICPNGLLLRHPAMASCDGRYMQRDYMACLRCQTAENSARTAWKRLLLTPMRRWLSARATANIGVTDHVRKRIDLPRSCFIYHGLPAQETAAQSRPTDHPVRFAYVGRLVAEKGLHTLLVAARQLDAARKPFELLLIGDGSMAEALKDTATGLSQVRFTGFIQPQSLPETVATVDVLILPSIWEETAGLVAIEQMHRGRAVIAADIGGLAEIVGDTAHKFPPGDAEALADAMVQYMDNRTRVVADGEAGRQRARQLFRVETMVQAHLDLYQRLIGKA